MKKQEMKRQVKWRSEIIKHVFENSKNVAKSCRHFGISRKTYYKWIKSLSE